MIWPWVPSSAAECNKMSLDTCSKAFSRSMKIVAARDLCPVLWSRCVLSMVR